MSEVTYIFKDGKTYAIHQGKVIAASADPDEVQRQVKNANYGDFLEHGGGGGDPDQGYEEEYGPNQPGESQSCPSCGAPNKRTPFCPECGMPLSGHGDVHGGQGMENMYPHDEPSPGFEMGGEGGSYMAKVTTPNGLKGTVLGKVAGLWGDEVTVRLENGRIVKLPTGTELRSQKVASAPVNSPIDRLESRLAATPDGTRESLVERSQHLAGIKRSAAGLVRDGVSFADSVRLDRISVTADVEQAEITDAVAHLDDVESIAAPGFSMGVAQDTPGISREDASWLDHTVNEMIAEAEATDFTKLMDEGPEAFAAELPDVALADTGVTRQMASSFIAEKTAGVDRTIAEPYMTTFLSRVEQCRSDELANRKQTTHKEAAAQEDKYKDLPDECIFLS